MVQTGSRLLNITRIPISRLFTPWTYKIENNNVQNNFYEDIVTGRPGARPGFAPKPASDRNVFDVIVSADQNYGSNNNANQHPELFNRYPSGKKSKKSNEILAF